MRQHVLWTLISFAVLTACSDSDKGAAPIPGSELPALTVDQQTRLSTATQELNDVSLVTISTDDVGTGTQLSAKASQIKKLVDKPKMSGACKSITIGNPTDTGSDIINIDTKYSVEVTDESVGSCPMYSFTSGSILGNLVENNGSVSGSMKINNSAKFYAKEATELYNSIDIYSIEQSGSFDMNMSGNENSMKVTATGKLTNTSKSKKEGQITSIVSISANASGNQNASTMSLELVVDITLSDFRAVAVVRGSASNGNELTPSYYLNGKPSTEEELNKLFGATMLDDMMKNAPM